MSQQTNWTNELLDEMRLQQDEVADKAAAALFESFETLDRASINRFMAAFASADFSHHWQADKYKNLFPSGLTDYFDNYDEFHYTDEERMILEKGSEFFSDNGPASCIALGVRSLLKTICCHKSHSSP